jgi:alpha-N-arabinofuranosidase
MYKGHQGARLLESSVEARNISSGGHTVPDLHLSASQDESGAIRATLANLSLREAQGINCELPGSKPKTASARVLTGKMGDHNDFDATDRVKPQPFESIKTIGGELHFQIPPCSVMEIIIEAE